MSSTPESQSAENQLPVQGGAPVDIRHLSAQQLQALGMAQIAYVKRVVVDGETAFAIHAADGTPMALAGDCDVAFAAIRQHEMMPILVH
jgi:hypothetical protein